jgi:hypothetical protein
MDRKGLWKKGRKAMKSKRLRLPLAVIIIITHHQASLVKHNYSGTAVNHKSRPGQLFEIGHDHFLSQPL